MAKLRAFSNTDVTLAKTQADLETLLDKHGVKASRWTHYAEDQEKKTPGSVVFEFPFTRPDGSTLEYRISVEYMGEKGPKGGKLGTTREQAARALFWHVKNLFDAAEWGIVTIEEAFLPYMLTHSGYTVFQEMEQRLPAVAGGAELFALEYCGKAGE